MSISVKAAGMNLPIKFPDNAQVIAEEAARFRALTPDDRARTLGEMFQLYTFLAEHSGRPEAIAQLAREEEANERKAIEEFAARHASEAT